MKTLYDLASEYLNKLWVLCYIVGHNWQYTADNIIRRCPRCHCKQRKTSEKFSDKHPANARAKWVNVK